MNSDDFPEAAVVEALVVAWQQRDFASFGSLLADDVTWYDPAMPNPPSKGRAAVLAFARTMIFAFPDIGFTVRSSVCWAPDGQTCAVPWHITGTHSHRLDPPGFAPTGQVAAFDGLDLIHFREGLVYKIETFFDLAVPAEQLLRIRLRPKPGNWRERILVFAQRRWAWFLRRRSKTRRDP
ncbi:MAG TPA: nuclear transport factor 2 family protein [Xanthomonadaceae bacterium]|nr:nuclear transport factor 2 family protein [Xanthomonadaceae bacterium]